jgi:hypothetical protein
MAAAALGDGSTGCAHNSASTAAKTHWRNARVIGPSVAQPAIGCSQHANGPGLNPYWTVKVAV